MKKVQALFLSRRFYAALIALIAVLFQDKLGLTQDAAKQLSTVVIAWIIGDSINKT